MYARADNVRNSTLAFQREARSTSLLAALVRMCARADNVRNSTLAFQREARSTSLLTAALVRMCARAGKVAELGTWYHGNAGGDDVVRRDSSAIR